ncbi:DUF885 domain-containing protein [Microbulbifer epialgicus]|uniref:DUF885 family protein n=1 Tax=Microbulbifer epialgicus TaxID=393907 RepID=A0ABV4P7I0_9GAMM
MIKKTFKLSGLILLLAFLTTATIVINTVYFKPWSINLFFERAFFKLGTANPETLTRLRLFEQFGIDGHNAHLDDLSDAESQRQIQIVKNELNVLRQYDRSELSGQQLISYDVLEYLLSDLIERDRWKYHNYPVNQLFGVQNNLPQFLSDEHQINNIKDADYYLSRLAQVDRKFSQLINGLKTRESIGVFPPLFVVNSVLKEMRNFVGDSPEENILYTSLVQRLDNISDLPLQERQRILDQSKLLIRESVYPAYHKLISYFESLEPKVKGNNGVWSLPNGDELYAYRVRQFTTTSKTPEELHLLGLKEVARIESEMKSIFNELGDTTSTINEYYSSLNNTKNFLYEDSSAGRDQIIRDYQTYIDEASSAVDNYFDIVPVTGVEVRRVPEYREQGAPGAYYSPPAMDGSRPGIFYANLREVQETKKFGMRTLTYHEAIPGHHFQIAIAQKLNSVPTFRKMPLFNAYSEGWALYAEQLAKEVGLQENPYDDLGRLQAEMHRAVRLVVDTGLHFKRWNREEAIEYMQSKTGLPVSEVTTEVERYLVDPGQALAYKTGMLTILDLREKAQRELSENFNVKKFHNVILTNGALPLSVLEQQVENWVISEKK